MGGCGVVARGGALWNGSLHDIYQWFAGGAVKPANFCWDPGGAGSIVLVRAYYTWPLIVPVLNASLKTTGAGNNRLITSATSFRNEPYSPTALAPVACPAIT